jgi:BirA family biotin operon repressor/biotin-[acetyl-CoA-carboxylase] ligase
VGKRVAVVDEVASTNDAVLEALARDGEGASGLVLFAEKQTAGRGRHGRPWHSRPGKSLTFSAAVRARSIPSVPALVAATAVALREAAERESGTTLRIKWPNDLLAKGLKVCGILVEARSQGAHVDLAIGVGLNVNEDLERDLDPSVRTTATSLAAVAGHSIDRSKLAYAILSRLDERMERALTSDLAPIERAFAAGLALLEKRVRIDLLNGFRVGTLAGFECAKGVALRSPVGVAWYPAESVTAISEAPTSPR